MTRVRLLGRIEGVRRVENVTTGADDPRFGVHVLQTGIRAGSPSFTVAGRERRRERFPDRFRDHPVFGLTAHSGKYSRVVGEPTVVAASLTVRIHTVVRLRRNPRVGTMFGLTVI